MPTTLILLFHPDLNRSHANAALASVAARMPGVEVVDMYALYRHTELDVGREVERLLNADRLVLQFPVHWYAPPALLQSWKDAVLTRMFYQAYDSEGCRFSGTPLWVVATAGNTPEAYSPEGVNRFALEELLRPLQAVAHRCGLPWATPFLVYQANTLGVAELADQAQQYLGDLQQWIANTPPAANG